jgi:hypothetical protein
MPGGFLMGSGAAHGGFRMVRRAWPSAAFGSSDEGRAAR